MKRSLKRTSLNLKPFKLIHIKGVLFINYLIYLDMKYRWINTIHVQWGLKYLGIIQDDNEIKNKN